MQKQTLIGIMLIVMGVASLALSQIVGGTNIRDFISGVMLGLSICEMLAGIYIVGWSLRK